MKLETIKARALADKHPPKVPYFMAVVGAPRSGKSDLMHILKEKEIIDPKTTVIISEKLFEDWPPRKALKIQGYQHPAKLPQLEQDYHRTVERIIDTAIARKLSIVLEDLGDQPAWLMRMTEKASKASAGYEKALVGMSQDETRYFKEAQRREDAGKVVDHARTLDMIAKLSSNWEDYLKQFDYSMLYFRKGEENPQLVATFAKEIHDEKTYEQFKRQSNIRPTLPPEEAWQAARAVDAHDNHRGGLEKSKGGILHGTRWQQLVNTVRDINKHGV